MRSKEGAGVDKKERVPQRKPNRLQGYNYADTGVYFLTICAKEKKPLFSGISVGAAIGRPPAVVLSPIGIIVENTLLEIPYHYVGVSVDHYVIMPDHLHVLLRLQSEDGRPMAAPTVQQIVNQFKGTVTKRIGKAVWQKGFHDHIVRDDYDYQTRWQYIDENPRRWLEKQEDQPQNILSD